MPWFVILLIVFASFLVLFFAAYAMVVFNAFKMPIAVKARIERIFGIISKSMLITLVSAFFVIPIWTIIAASFTDFKTFARNGYSMWIPKFSIAGYRYVFSNNGILRGLLNSVIFTTLVTIGSLVINTSAAYVLSEKRMPGHALLNRIFVFTMLFSTGMVPIVLVMRQIGMYDKPVALVIPAIINVYNILLIRNYMYSIPSSLKEAARIDGAGHIRVFLKVILPVSVPIIATTGMMAFVLKWNSYMDILYYLSPGEASRKYWTIQYVIMDMLMNLTNSGQDGVISKYVIQSSTIIVTIIPLLVAFPFVQKYFQKGLTLGSTKG